MALAEQSGTVVRRLGSFPLPSGLKIKLARSGYEVSHDLRGIDVRELARGEVCGRALDVGVSEEEAKLILDCVLGRAGSVAKEGGGEQHGGPLPRPPGDGRGATLLELLKQEQELGSIVTFCARVDEMLGLPLLHVGGGVHLGKMTEVCGVAGAGKTQFCMQLAVDVTIPEEFGGVCGHAVYVDTEGSLVAERLAEMAVATVQHIGDVTQAMEEREDKADLLPVAQSYTFERVVRSVHCLRCCSLAELLAVSHLLPEMVEENPAIKLVVIDSVASPFRTELPDARLRTRVLNGMAQGLIKLATAKGLAVVLTNHMVAHSASSGGVGRSQLVPALGESWGHSCTVRLALLRDRGTRRAVLLKSPCKREASVPFQITPSGVRDVEVDPTISPVGVSSGGMLDDLTADLQEQEVQELLASQEGEVEQRSKRPHLDSSLDGATDPLSSLHTNEV